MIQVIQVDFVFGKNVFIVSEEEKVLPDTEAIIISVPNKVNFLQEHLEDCLDMTGEGLGQVDDGVVEAMHQFLDKRMRISNYVVKNLESKAHSEKKLKLVLHINGYIL